VWENGVKGIPTYPVGITMQTTNPSGSYYINNSGATDVTSTIQAAINACPAYHAVYIPDGSYRCNGSLNMKSDVVVRGAGSTTVLLQYQTTNKGLFIFSGTGESAAVNMLSGYTKGSDTITVSNASGFAVGNLVYMDQLNDPSLVTIVGPTGSCTWCGRGSGARAYAEVALVKAVNGNTIQLNRPIYYNFSSTYSPQILCRARNPLKWAGVEDLKIDGINQTTTGSGVAMAASVYCWVKNVESKDTPFKHIELWDSDYGCEIRGCYIHGAQNFTGDEGYGVGLTNYCCSNLIEDNIFYYLREGVTLGSAGSAGNVIAYNYLARQHHSQPNWMNSLLNCHGAHTFMNLFEGNVTNMIGCDDYWGSGSNNIFFRNYVDGKPVDTQYQNIMAIMVNTHNYYYSFIGNILGYYGTPAVVEQIPYTSFDNNPVLWYVGYACCANTGNPVDNNVYGTMLKEGNYQYPYAACQWSAGVESIPDSLYLSSKPAWFGILQWPPFTPDRQGFDPNSLNKIPAQVRYENGPMLGLSYDTSRGF
jgi:hypothetical protein